MKTSTQNYIIGLTFFCHCKLALALNYNNNKNAQTTNVHSSPASQYCLLFNSRAVPTYMNVGDMKYV